MALQLREYIVEKSEIPVGRACRQGSDPSRAILGITLNSFIGLSIRDLSFDTAHIQIHPVGKQIIIAIAGTFWVRVESAVVMGAHVTANTITGQLSTKSIGAKQILISGARWITTQITSNELAEVYLDGTIPKQLKE